jgi:glycerophosphoryl diester phosphodiesterase
LISIERPLLLGHRGARVPGLPENTIAAFDRALAQGCDGFEFDVRLTRDGQAAVCHDRNIGRMAVAASTYAELAQSCRRHARSRFPSGREQQSPEEELTIPTLESVLARYADRAFLDVELKVSGIEAVLTDHLQRYAPRRGCVVSSFLPEVLEAMRARDDAIPLGLICDTTRQLATWPALPVSYVIAHQKLVTRKLLSEVRGTGKKLFVWTVNREDDMRRLGAWGVDGIISDDPGLLARVLASSPRTSP